MRRRIDRYKMPFRENSPKRSPLHVRLKVLEGRVLNLEHRVRKLETEASKRDQTRP